MNNYTIEIEVYSTTNTGREDEFLLKRFLRGNDLEALKSEITPNIEDMCKQQNITGVVFVDVLIECNGEYFDSEGDEYDLVQRRYLNTA